MNVHLGSTLDHFVAELLESGLYQSQSEVVREGLRLLKEREDLRRLQLEELRREVRIGIEQADRGEVRPLDDTTFARIRERGQKKLEARRSKKG